MSIARAIPVAAGRVCDDPILMKAITNRPRIVDSRNDLAIKRIRRLHVRAERERSGLFYVEGLRFIATTIRHHILHFAPGQRIL